MSTPKFPKPSEFAADTRVQLVEETGHYIFTDPSDGGEYEYDEAKGAWFPMWNESLVEQQQSIYGTEQDDDVVEEQESTKRKNKGLARKKENTSVYVSGLPLDTTDEEMVAFFSQCGTIMPDIVTNKPRVKLYRDASGELKGDALVTYYKAPSVQLAVDILDDSRFRPTNSTNIQVQEAKFENKAEHSGEADKTKRLRVDSKLVQKRLNQLERKLDWVDDAGEVADRHKRTVILKHMFTLKELEEDITMLLDLPEDVRAECEKLGKVTSVKVYDLSEDGVIAVKFKDELSAKACVQMMNGRFFGGRQVEATIYDGQTRYKSSKESSKAETVASTSDAQPGRSTNSHGSNDGDEARMEQYAQWLDSGN
ncbi:hypothetical protein LPJ77_001384 [Coemansia sp. RSA 2523]|nr:hypothetical protein LPJ58_001200 [Coemansia sp. RSA 1591]KAJ1765648.1 hypothetical protein LPJ69_001195 [Coemansia sp. RSA 1752]KAJ1779423.1 hypothetical protein LPJ54_000934 [Coemansia sp. RSA 1824]KAJ1809804.1 hypothetical protein LPJ77_001384 [Coemansia sp. RSA 2523]KAJ2150430.1 hypothetical protein J3F82_003986 [Coemansia sp. RSA 637]KAJ2272284.1 hypothetical protein EV176_003711 [Coemansia sp. RSA 451]KAJ2575330.1 hypothetical protein GGH19_003081 [Coemansia sp. RSA 1807]